MYTIEWIGTAALGVLQDGKRQLTFSLREDQAVPEEFKQGDEVQIVNHPDHPANVTAGMNSGHYNITHLKSGKVLDIYHSTTQYMFE